MEPYPAEVNVERVTYLNRNGFMCNEKEPYLDVQGSLMMLR